MFMAFSVADKVDRRRYKRRRVRMEDEKKIERLRLITDSRVTSLRWRKIDRASVRLSERRKVYKWEDEDGDEYLK